MQFQDELAGGVTLVRPALQSPGYVTGSSGWAVKVDGSAEFNNVVIRGSTTVGGNGFYYSGTPAAGNLIMSVSAAAGTDTYGNAYTAGVGVYGTADRVTARSTSGDTVALRADAVSYVADSTSPGIQFRKSTDTGDGASITEYDDTFSRGMLLLSPSPVNSGSGGEDFAYIQLDGKFATDPAIQLNAFGPNSTIGLNGMILDKDGTIQAYPSFNTYTPVVTGGGSVTWTQRTGWWQRVGKMVYFAAYLTVNAAGSGATALTITAPTSIDRTTRQVVMSHAEQVTSPNSGTGVVVAFQSGTGNVWDRIRNSTNASLIGSDLLASAVLTLEGWYREE